MDARCVVRQVTYFQETVVGQLTSWLNAATNWMWVQINWIPSSVYSVEYCRPVFWGKPVANVAFHCVQSIDSREESHQVAGW